MTDGAGRPVAVDVYPGNTGDPATVPDQVEKLRTRFRLQRVVLVGDRGMLTHTQIDALRGYPGVGWISALRCPAIRTLAEHGAFPPSLFDTPHLAEITSDAYPGERLVVCDNPALAADRARTRDELLAATEARLARIAAAVARRTKTPMTADEIGVTVGQIINHYTGGTHFDLTTDDGWPVQSLRTLLSALGTRCKNTCRAGTGTNVLRFEQLTETSPFQQHVFSLLGLTP